jgi:hypothetical protein
MTPIATKNNAIILKDGKLAENCGCCGGWWCYDGAASGDCFCICEDSSKTLPNVLLFSCTASSWNPTVSGWPSPATPGDIELVRPTSCTALEWSGSYLSEGQQIIISVFCTNCSVDTSSYGEGMNVRWHPASNYGLSYANTLLTSLGRFSATDGKSALNDLCGGATLSTFQAGATYTATVRRGS